MQEPDYNALTTGAFSPGGGFIITGGDDGTARVWDLDSGQPFVSFAGHQGPISALAVNNAGTAVITASADGTAKVWSTQPSASASFYSTRPTTCVASPYSPTNPYLLAVGADNGTVTLWNTRTRSQIARWSTRSDKCASAEFSHSGRFLVTTDGTQKARIWALSNPAERPCAPPFSTSTMTILVVHESCRLQHINGIYQRGIQPERKIRRDRRRGRQRMRLARSERNALPQAS